MVGYFEVPNLPIVELYVTDYSINEHLFLFTDEHKHSKGIIGQRVLMIAFWHDAAGDLSTFEKGSIKVLDNVRGKVSPAGILQGAVSLEYSGSGTAWRAPIRAPDGSHEGLIRDLQLFVQLTPSMVSSERARELTHSLVTFSVVEMRIGRRATTRINLSSSLSILLAFSNLKIVTKDSKITRTRL